MTITLRLNLFFLVILFGVSCSSQKQKENSISSLHEASAYPIGTGISLEILKDSTTRTIVLRDFNSITAEGAMKMANILNSKQSYDWSEVDQYVEFAGKHNFRLHGHTLIWHSSTPEFVTQMEGDSSALYTFTKDFIETYLTRYKGKVPSWDVVNEPVVDHSGAYRKNVWYNTFGKDYFEMVFRMAHEADPEAKLFLNDFNIERDTAKLNGLLRIVEDLRSKDVPIHGIGMQMHIRMDIPNETIAYCMKKCAETGLLIHLSEMDIIFNKHDDTRGGGIQLYNEMTGEMAQQQKEKYRQVAEIYNEVVPEDQQFGITLWNFADSDTWIRGFFDLKDWPCIYDDSLRRKPAFYGLLEGLQENK